MIESGVWRCLAQRLRSGCRLLAIIALFIFPAAETAAEPGTYPDRQIRIIASFPPGTAMDIVARIVSVKLSAAVGQLVVVRKYRERCRQPA